MRIKRIQTPFIVGLLLFVLIALQFTLPQLALAQGPALTVGPVPQDLTSTTVTIYFSTNTSSIGCVYYGINTTGTWAKKCDSTAVVSHFIELTGLAPSTTYYYWIQATDASGTATYNNTGSYYTFTTGPPTYSITLYPACGVCGDLVEVGVCGEVIGVEATVAAAGTYHICWDSKAAANVVGTFTASEAGVHTLTFYMPEATKGIHTVYLVDNTYTERAKANFEVFPSVKIDPEKGPVGTNVTLNFYGFNASQDIQVKFKGTVIGTNKTNAVGSWTMSYTIPPTPAGGYTFDIEAKEGTVWVNWVSKYFKVTPKITVTPDSGTVGKAIKIDGTGFASKEGGIKITFDGGVRKENILADVDGSWTDYITVPIRTCGRYPIDASGTSTRARDIEDVMFTLVPGISVEPTSAYVGDTITIRGGGFAPGEKGIWITFEGTVVTSDTITADIYGCWQSSFEVPASAYGPHIVSASGETTAAVTTTFNTQAQITAFNPEEGAPGDFISLTGDGFGSSKKLTVSIGGVAASEDMSSQPNGNVVISFRVPKGVSEGQRTLVVTDEGGATASVDFTVKKKILSTTPLPISPKDSTLRSGTVTFKWQGVTGSTDYTYTLEISGEGFIWSKSGITGSSYTLTDTETVTESLPSGTYNWRVKIVDDYGNEGPWSKSIGFRVSPIPTWVWVVVGLVVLVGLMVVAYRETKFKVTE